VVDVARASGISGALIELGRQDGSQRRESLRSDPRAPVKGDARQNRSGAEPSKPQSAEQPVAKPVPDRRPGDERELAGLDLSSPVLNPVYEALQYQIALSRSRLAGLEKQQAAIESLGVRLRTASKELSAADMAVKRLETEYELATRIYEDIAFQYEQARTSVTRRSAQLQVIDDAIRPERPVSRGIVRWGLAAFAGGALLTCVFVLGARQRPGGRRD
jgi:hypothetical protein